jgi:hypothetical protein
VTASVSLLFASRWTGGSTGTSGGTRRSLLRLLILVVFLVGASVHGSFKSFLYGHAFEGNAGVFVALISQWHPRQRVLMAAHT